jgi:hypothetical protein
MKLTITLLLLLIGGIAFGQPSKQKHMPIASDTLTVEVRYERMLLDSLIVLEELKPVHHKLQIAYEARGEEINQLWSLLRLREVQDKLSKDQIGYLNKQLTKSNRKSWIKGFAYGAGGAIVLSTLTRLLTR